MGFFNSIKNLHSSNLISSNADTHQANTEWSEVRSSCSEEQLQERSFKKYGFRVACILILLFATCIYVYKVFSWKDQLINNYQLAIKEMEDENYQGAMEIFLELGDYKDSLSQLEIAQEKVKEIQMVKTYEQAVELFEAERYEQANKLFSELGNFQESEKYKSEIQENIDKQDEKKNLYNKMLKYYNLEKYEEALAILEELDDYEDSESLAQNCRNILRRLEQSKTISAGINYSAAVTREGKVLFAGHSFPGRKNIEEWDDIISVAVMGNIVVGLKKDGTVVTATKMTIEQKQGETDVVVTSNDYRLGTETWNNILEVAAGEQYIVALREDGTLLALGHNGDGQINIDEWENIVAIAAGWRHTVGLDANGYIHITGFRDHRQEEEINNMRDENNRIVAIDAGGGSPGIEGEKGHTVALRQDHTVVAVGDNDRGQCNVEEWRDIIAISAGAYHTVGLKEDGTVVTTQDKNSESYKEISSWKNIVAVSAGYGFTLGVTSDGKIVGAGFNKNGQRDTDGWGKVAFYKEWNRIFDNYAE